MAYVTGSAGNVAALRDALTTAAVANGWSWDSTFNILSKGSVFAKLITSGSKLMVETGLGASGVNLTNGSGQSVGVSDVLSGSPNVPLSYPLTYHIFINASPNEIVLAVNYQTSWWQWLGFGSARVLGQQTNPIWQWGTCNNSQLPNEDGSLYDGVEAALDVNNSNLRSYSATSGIPFWNPGYHQSFYPTHSMYGDIDGNAWLHGGAVNLSGKSCATEAVTELLKTQPNVWNGEALLCRVQVLTARASDFRSYVAELGHLRLTRNDNFSDGQIVTLGSDEWFVAPAYRKDLNNRNGTSYGNPNNRMSHSGTIAIAVRKT